jgi:vacuolar iron transporter family protein
MSARRAQVERLGRIRQLIFGVQDGLLTTIGVVAGVSGATAHNYTILVAGFAEAAAGMLAMGAGEYVSARSQTQVYDAEIDTEREEVKHDPEAERREVSALFQEEGLSREDAEVVARLITTSHESWIKTMVEKELGIAASDRSGALAGAVVMGVTFLAGALVPIVPYLFFPARSALIVAVVLTLLVLAGMGVGKALLARLNPLTSALETVAIGSFAAIFGYLVGTLLLLHLLHAG